MVADGRFSEVLNAKSFELVAAYEEFQQIDSYAYPLDEEQGDTDERRIRDPCKSLTLFFQLCFYDRQK